MKKNMLVASLLLLALALCAPRAGQGAKLPADPTPDEQSLLLAWERVQSQDPHTKQFKKLGERRYLLETDLFPFKDEVRVLHLTVDDEYPDEIEGFIAVELAGVDKDFRARYAGNYRVWARHNRLIWSSDVNKWLTNKEYGDLQKSLKVKKETSKAGARSALAARLKTFAGILSLVLFWLFALAFCIAQFLGYRKQSALRKQLLEEQRQIKALLVRSAKQQHNANLLLQAIYKRLGTAKP